MRTKNLAELYDLPTIPWESVRERLESEFAQPPASRTIHRGTIWLTTVNPDGSPHVNGVGAVFHDGSFWFTTGRGSRKGRNVDHDARVSVGLSVGDFDLVVEGVATLVDEPGAVADLARIWSDHEGWPCEVDASGTALTAPFSAPSAGPPPWHVYRIDATAAHAVLGAEPGGATRWTF